MCGSAPDGYIARYRLLDSSGFTCKHIDVTAWHERLGCAVISCSFAPWFIAGEARAWRNQ